MIRPSEIAVQRMALYYANRPRTSDQRELEVSLQTRSRHKVRNGKSGQTGFLTLRDVGPHGTVVAFADPDGNEFQILIPSGK